MLRTLGFPAVPLHGQLSQSQRLGALGKFKSGGRRVLVATDIASRYVIHSLVLKYHLDSVTVVWTYHQLTWLSISISPHTRRITSTGWAEQPVLDALANPSR